MTTRKAELGELETLILLAVLRLGDAAYVRRIREEVATRGGRELSRGATYATISRLERKGFVELVEPDPNDASEGQVKRSVRITGHGLDTLRAAQGHLIDMRAGLESILDGSS